MLAYKIVMVGDFGVGKTSLVKRFVDNSFSEEYLSTIGVSISKKIMQNSTLMLWDIEGRTEFKPVFKQYFLGAKGFIVVADITREDTIESIEEHIKLCHSIIKDAPVVIALNKSDMQASFDQAKLDALTTLSPSIVNILTTSAKSGEGVEEIFHSLDDFIVEHLNR